MVLTPQQHAPGCNKCRLNRQDAIILFVQEPIFSIQNLYDLVQGSIPRLMSNIHINYHSSTKQKQFHGHTDTSCFTVSHTSAVIPAQPARQIYNWVFLIYRGPYQPPCTKATRIQNFIPTSQARPWPCGSSQRYQGWRESPFFTYLYLTCISRSVSTLKLGVLQCYMSLYNTTKHSTTLHTVTFL